MICTRNRQLRSSRYERLKKVDPFYVSLAFPDSYFFSATYAIAIRSSEYEPSPPIDHIVSQAVSGDPEPSEEPGPLSRQKHPGDIQGPRQ
jgi:hypothetical protein